MRQVNLYIYLSFLLSYLLLVIFPVLLSKNEEHTWKVLFNNPDFFCQGVTHQSWNLEDVCIYCPLFLLSSPVLPVTVKASNNKCDSCPFLQGQRFSPRSFGGPPQEYPVQFPLARPSSDNLQAICLNGDRRPRYPQSYFPPSYFSKQRREGSAVNEAESWFSTCCKGNETWGLEATLCCATQAVSFQNHYHSWFS